MKQPWICILTPIVITAFFLSSCATGGATNRQINCSNGGEICVTINPDEPIHFDDPVVVTIKVTSSKDISDLHLALHTLPVVKVSGPQTWESGLNSTFHEPGLATWNFDIKAGETLIFIRTLYFPPEEGYFTVGVTVATFGQTLAGSDSFTVHTAHDGEYYKEGASIPNYTPNVTAAAYGPGTPVPTKILATYPWEGSAVTATQTPAPVRQATQTPTPVAPREASPYPPPYQ